MIAATAIEDMRSRAIGLSVTLTASTPARLSRRAASMTADVSTPRGGSTSAVTTNASARASWPLEARRLDRGSADPRGGALGHREDARRGGGPLAARDLARHRADVLGSRAAAPPDDRRARLDERPRVVPEVIGRGEVEVAAVERPPGSPRWASPREARGWRSGSREKIS